MDVTPSVRVALDAPLFGEDATWSLQSPVSTTFKEIPIIFVSLVTVFCTSLVRFNDKND